MSVQQILDTGTVDQSLDVATLEEARKVLEFQIQELQQSAWGAAGSMLRQRHSKALEEVMRLLNDHRGSDGMTPLSA